MEQKILTKKQKKTLEIISKDKVINDNFYLSGDPALITYYLPYRFSEDLDFFSEKEFNTESIVVFLKKNKGFLGYKKFDSQKSFNRNLFFLYFNKNEILKLEFTYYPFKQIEKPKKVKGLKVDSLLDIATNKAFTISQNPRTRDFMDLYFIIKEKGWNFFELLKKARAKFDWHIDPVNLGSQLMKCQNKGDYPRLLEKVNDKEWQDFYLKIAKEIGKEV